MISIVEGGNSAERKVSLRTSQTIQAALRRLHLDFCCIDQAEPDWLEKLVALKPEVVIVALHGTFGEDGTIQQQLERSRLKFTGSSSTASALSFNKKVTKEKVAALGVAVPPSLTTQTTASFPIVIKPNRQGSSYGVTIVTSANQLQSAINAAQHYDSNQEFLIEPKIAGQEVTCAVIDVFGQLQPLPLVEIIPRSSFFDYEAKYSTESGCQEICPANLDDKLTSLIQEQSVNVFKAFGLRQYARIDWIVKDTIPYFLEVNTLPGMTPTSLINKELQQANIPLEKFVQQLVKTARF